MSKLKTKTPLNSSKWDSVFNFFTRFSPIIAICALALSIFNVWDTRDKWDELNNANVVITDLKTTLTGTVNADSLNNIDFGFKNPLYGASETNDVVNLYHF